MDIRHLTLKNYNNRDFKVTYYGLQENDQLVVKKRPLIVILPGGSFNHLALREGEPVALAYASRGFNAAVVSYNLTIDPGKIYPDAALSGLKTIEFFRENSERLNIDPEKIVTIGFSAGGHVVSAMNVMATSDKWQKEFKLDAAKVKPNATILGYPLINIEKIGFPLAPEDREKMPAEPELLDSALGVTPDTPATFIFQTADDPTVLIDNSLEYLMALRKNNVPFEAHLFDRGGHGYSLGRPEIVVEGRQWQLNPHVAHWFNLSFEWLEHLKIAA